MADQFFDDFNDTELAAIAALNGIPGFHRAGVTKAYPRSVLLQVVEKLEPPTMEPAVMTERRKIFKFVKRNEARFRSQAPYRQCFECIDGKTDIKDGKFKRCSDLQAMDCFHKNRDRLP
jgi:hypothetical protein